MLGNVEHTSGTSVIHLEGHTLLESTVGLDVNDVSSAVSPVVGGEMLNAVLAEVTGEHVARSAPDTLGVNHLRRCGFPWKKKINFEETVTKMAFPRTDDIINEEHRF